MTPAETRRKHFDYYLWARITFSTTCMVYIEPHDKYFNYLTVIMHIFIKIGV